MSSIALLLFGVVAVTGKVTAGSSFSESFSEWEYLDRFCYSKDTGTLNIKGSRSDTPGREGTELFLYHDVAGSGFDSVYKSGRSCEWKRAQASRVIKLGENSVAASETGKTFFPQNALPRWWYLVAANCGGDKLGVLDYEFTWTNGEEHDGKFQYQFGVNEQGIFEALIFTCIALLVLILLTIYTAPQACRSCCKLTPVVNKVHHVMRVLLYIESIVFVAVVFQLIDREIYSNDGVGVPELKHLGLMLELLPDIMMVALFLFLSKGYLTRYDKIPTSDLRHVAEISVVYIACEIALLVWEFNDIDPIYHFYRYQGQAGIILCVLRVFLALYFIQNCYISYTDSIGAPNHQLFFTRFAFVGGLFFLVMPMSVIVAHYSNSHNMEKVVTITEMLANLFFYWCFYFFFICNSEALRKDAGETDMNRNLRHSEIGGGGGFRDDDVDDEGVDIDDIDVDPRIGDDENEFLTDN